MACSSGRGCIPVPEEDSIREVIAFPKVKDASCLMTGAPGIVEEKQLEELCLKVVEKEQKKEE